MGTQTPGVGVSPGIRGPSQDGEESARPQTPPSGATTPRNATNSAYTALPFLIPLVVIGAALTLLAVTRRRHGQEPAGGQSGDGGGTTRPD